MRGEAGEADADGAVQRAAGVVGSGTSAAGCSGDGGLWLGGELGDEALLGRRLGLNLERAELEMSG